MAVGSGSLLTPIRSVFFHFHATVDILSTQFFGCTVSCYEYDYQGFTVELHYSEKAI